MSGTAGNGSGVRASDVAELIKAVEDLHQVRCTVVWSVGGLSGKSLVASVVATPRATMTNGTLITDAASPRSWAVESFCPDRPVDGLFSWLYGLVTSLDGVLSRERWEQTRFA